MFKHLLIGLMLGSLAGCSSMSCSTIGLPGLNVEIGCDATANGHGVSRTVPEGREVGVDDKSDKSEDDEAKQTPK